MKIRKSNLHPNNPHNQGYDFEALVNIFAELNEYVILNPHQEKTIDFTNPKAVLSLNTALLKLHYDIKNWSIPDGFLCPPIPGRADYMLNIADLLSEDFHNKRAKGHKVKMWDIGIGANCIYPLLAHQMFNWSCTGSEIDDTAIQNAQTILKENSLENKVSILKQSDPQSLIKNLLAEGDYYDVIICNPPFHESPQAIIDAAELKWKKLGKSQNTAQLNFGGQSQELWCEGGELGFVTKLISESADLPNSVMWFTSLVSRQENLDILVDKLSGMPKGEYRIIPMSQGQKKSRILAWTYLTRKQRKAWINYRWN